MTTPPTVVIATRVYEPEATAAAYRLGNLARALETAGNRVIILTTSVPGGPRSTRAIRRWPVVRDRSGAVRGYIQYLSFDIPLFFRILLRPRADVVIVEPPPTTGFVTRVACRMRGIPYVYFSADVLSSAVQGIGAHRFVVSAVKWLESFSVCGARGVLAISSDVRSKVIELGADPERTVDVGTGIDTAQFSPVGRVAAPGRPYFVYAGTMSEVHGAGVFIDAFELLINKYPETDLRVFGAGVEVESLAQRSRPLGDRVTFSSLISGDELAPWLRGAVASLASVRPDRGYDFAFATKALASLACGTPVVYAGVGPLGPLITEHNLGWSASWAAVEVAAAMESALARPENTRGPRLAEWVEKNYSSSSVASRAAQAINGWTRRGGSSHLG